MQKTRCLLCTGSGDGIAPDAGVKGRSALVSMDMVIQNCSRCKLLRSARQCPRRSCPARRGRTGDTSPFSRKQRNPRQSQTKQNPTPSKVPPQAKSHPDLQSVPANTTNFSPSSTQSSFAWCTSPGLGFRRSTSLLKTQYFFSPQLAGAGRVLEATLGVKPTAQLGQSNPNQQLQRTGANTQHPVIPDPEELGTPFPATPRGKFPSQQDPAPLQLPSLLIRMLKCPQTHHLSLFFPPLTSLHRTFSLCTELGEQNPVLPAIILISWG